MPPGLDYVGSGYHYHLVEAESQQRLDLIGQQLENAGLLAPLQPWERKKKEHKMTVAELQAEIIRLKKEKKIFCILAHAYQGHEILEVADYTGDSYGLSVEATAGKNCNLSYDISMDTAFRNHCFF